MARYESYDNLSLNLVVVTIGELRHCPLGSYWERSESRIKQRTLMLQIPNPRHPRHLRKSEIQKIIRVISTNPRFRKRRNELRDYEQRPS